MTKLNRKKVKEAIKDCYGLFSIVAKKCGVARSTMHDFIHKERNKDLLKLVRDEQEKILDIAEKVIFKKIGEENLKATQFYLKMKGRSRGYIERPEIEIPVLQQNQLNIFQLITEIVEENKRIETKENAIDVKPGNPGN